MFDKLDPVISSHSFQLMQTGQGGAFGIALAGHDDEFRLAAGDDVANTLEVWTYPTNIQRAWRPDTRLVLGIVCGLIISSGVLMTCTGCLWNLIACL